ARLVDRIILDIEIFLPVEVADDMVADLFDLDGVPFAGRHLEVFLSTQLPAPSPVFAAVQPAGSFPASSLPKRKLRALSSAAARTPRGRKNVRSQKRYDMVVLHRWFRDKTARSFYGSCSRYTVESALAVATCLPSGVNARLSTVCRTSQARSSLPVAVSQSLTTPSMPAVSNRSPLGLIANASTAPLWALKACIGSSLPPPRTFAT